MAEGSAQQAEGQGATEGAQAQHEARTTPQAIPYNRFQEVVHKKNEAQRRLAELEQRIAQYEGRDNPAKDDFPDINDPRFASLEDYKAAVRKHAETHAGRMASETAAQYRQRMEVETVVSSFNANAAEIAKTNPEIVQAIEHFKLYEEDMNPDVFRSIVADKNGPRIVLAIASNPELGDRLARATPFEAGRILASLDVNQTPTKQPIPVTRTVSGAASPKETDPAKMNQQEYFAWRQKQEF